MLSLDRLLMMLRELLSLTWPLAARSSPNTRRSCFHPLPVKSSVGLGGRITLAPVTSQEFFQLIFRDLFDAGYGMFVLDGDTRTYWLRASDIDMRTEFQLVGTMLALAVYNAHTLDVAFPMALWRCAPGALPGFATRHVSALGAWSR